MRGVTAAKFLLVNARRVARLIIGHGALSSSQNLRSADFQLVSARDSLASCYAGVIESI